MKASFTIQKVIKNNSPPTTVSRGTLLLQHPPMISVSLISGTSGLKKEQINMSV